MEESAGSDDDEYVTPDKFLSLIHYEEDKFYWTELEGDENTNSNETVIINADIFFIQPSTFILFPCYKLTKKKLFTNINFI